MRDTVLIVDDQKFNRQVLSDILSPKYKILEAADGQEGLKVLAEHTNEIAAMLLDIVMPKMSGPEMLLVMNDKKLMLDFPVIICTSENSMNVVEKCFSYGISDFIRKPFENDLVLQRIERLDNMFRERREYREKLENNAKVLKNQYAVIKQHAEAQKKTNTRLIDALGTIVEYRNTENHDHIRRVKAFTKIMATHVMNEFPEYGLTEEKVERITIASALHDIGKIMIPDNILFKPGKYTPEEFDYMKSHTIRGYDILNKVAADWDKDLMDCCLEIARSHHEKYDGRGYTDGLKGDDIPISAQIVSIADCFEALISESIYKRAYTFDVGFQMIINGDCGAFNPKLLEVFRESKEEFAAVAPEEDPDDAPQDKLTETNLR